MMNKTPPRETSWGGSVNRKTKLPTNHGKQLVPVESELADFKSDCSVFDRVLDVHGKPAVICDERVAPRVHAGRDPADRVVARGGNHGKRAEPT